MSADNVAKDSDMTPNQLAESCLGLAKRIAMRKARTTPACITFDELLSPAYLGLVDASRKYKPDRGVPFSGYAGLRISGAIQDYLRARQWVNPRSRMENIPSIQSLDMRQPNGDYIPTDEHDQVSAASQLDDARRQLDTEEFFTIVVRCLSEKQRTIIRMYYIDGKYFNDIAEYLGISQSRVCQLHQKACKLIALRWGEQDLKDMII